jgi:hypothetical protein
METFKRSHETLISPAETFRSPHETLLSPMETSGVMNNEEWEIVVRKRGKSGDVSDTEGLL